MNLPHLHVIEAIEGPLAFLLRRGASWEVCPFGWDREAQADQSDQWLKGCIHAHRNDLSPDGRHMISFATDGHRSWSVISRALWFSALAFLPQQTTWQGGGTFTPEGSLLWLNGGNASRKSLPDGLRAAPTDACPHSTDGFTDGDLHATAQSHRGWGRLSGGGCDITLGKELGPVLRLQMQISMGKKDRALFSNRYALRPEDFVQSKPDWDWAEARQEFLHISARAMLFAAEICRYGPSPARPLHDFSGMYFQQRTMPNVGAEGNVS
ncbi:MAG: hypothetical protein AAF636_10415 [Pseudomonadota bacterium]